MTTLEMVIQYPGMTSSEYAKLTGRKQNVLSGALIGLEKSKKVMKLGKKYFPIAWFNQSINVKTLGDLRKVLKDWEYMPDDWLLVTTNEDGDAIDIISINTHWYGAITFENDGVRGHDLTDQDAMDIMQTIVTGKDCGDTTTVK